MRYGVALASMYGHPGTDLKAGSRAVNDLFRLATSRIPYYNIGRHDTEEETARQLRTLKTLQRHLTPEVLEAQKRYEEEHGISDDDVEIEESTGLSLKRKNASKARS